MTDRKQKANAIRALAMDAVQKAKKRSPGYADGHGGYRRGAGSDYLKQHNPVNPTWPDRDRFVLSNGHGSMLHYALLHLSGYDLPIERAKELPSAAFGGRLDIRSTVMRRGLKPQRGL